MPKEQRINIEVLDNIQVKHFLHLHILKIKITALKNVEFKLNSIRCLNGNNVLNIDIDGLEMLKDKRIKKDEIIIGHMAFEKSDFATLKPMLVYEGKAIKTKKKPKKWVK
jgi:hypothetical protein